MEVIIVPTEIPKHQAISKYPIACFISEESDRDIVIEKTNVAIIAPQHPWMILTLILILLIICNFLYNDL